MIISQSQQTQTAANQSSRQARDRKLTIMVAVMVSMIMSSKYLIPTLTSCCPSSVAGFLMPAFR